MGCKAVDGARRIAMQQGRCNDQLSVDSVEPLARGMHVAQCGEKACARCWLRTQQRTVNCSGLSGIFDAGPYRQSRRLAQRVVRIPMRQRGTTDAAFVPIKHAIEQAHSPCVRNARGDRGTV